MFYQAFKLYFAVKYPPLLNDIINSINNGSSITFSLIVPTDIINDFSVYFIKRFDSLINLLGNIKLIFDNINNIPLDVLTNSISTISSDTGINNISNGSDMNPNNLGSNNPDSSTSNESNPESRNQSQVGNELSHIAALGIAAGVGTLATLESGSVVTGIIVGGSTFTASKEILSGSLDILVNSNETIYDLVNGMESGARNKLDLTIET
jgi:hypothetical protein